MISSSAGNGQALAYDIGAPVVCDDGACGELSRVVIDPLTKAITHLIVEPHHRHALARLVPTAMIDTAAGELRLRCSLGTFKALQYAEETEFLPPGDPWITTGYPPPGAYPGAMSYPGSGMLLWPYYQAAPTTVRHERVPMGEVEIRRGDHIHAADGHIGKVQGLVVDAADQHVTHVLIQAGHLWGARDVAIPIAVITQITAAGIAVSLSKHEIGELPEVGAHAP